MRYNATFQEAWNRLGEKVQLVSGDWHFVARPLRFARSTTSTRVLLQR